MKGYEKLNWVYTQEILSATETAILAYMVHRCGDKMYCFPDLDTIVRETKWKKSAVYKAIHQLIKLKFISTRKKGWRGWEINVSTRWKKEGGIFHQVELNSTQWNHIYSKDTPEDKEEKETGHNESCALYTPDSDPDPEIEVDFSKENKKEEKEQEKKQEKNQEKESGVKEVQEEEKIVKLEEVKKLMEEKLTEEQIFNRCVPTKGRYTVVALFRFWKSMNVFAKTGIFIPELSMKEKGQLSLIIQKCREGGEDPRKILAAAIKNWTRFVKYVRQEKGIQHWPADQNIGFVLQFLDLAVAFSHEHLKDEPEEDWTVPLYVIGSTK